MNVLNLRQSIDRFFEQLSFAGSFINGLKDLSVYLENSSGYFDEISAPDTNRINKAGEKLYQHFKNLPQLTVGISNRQFFKGLEHFQIALKTLKEDWSADEQPFDGLQRHIENFAELYDIYLGQQIPLNARRLLDSAQRLRIKISIFIEFLSSVREAVGPQEVPSSQDSKISVILPEHFSLKDFAERLLALQSIYSELCALFQVSEVDHPLRIGKVESGSLWALLFGNTRIVEMMASFIERSASWVYRNYTTEGKLNGLPRKVEAIDALLELTKRMEESNIDVSGMKPNIEKAALTLSKDLTTLIDGQPNITVNDEKLSLHDAVNQALLEGRAVRLLGSKASGTAAEESP
ncbi:hypothetical protein F3J24_02160 [Comamonas sp. Tr-654]|uniref:hypothetical protein n=1 Tax=Comamonas sp. Tr-654 TaxID=2608341 RepID=UPI001422B07E|nr:hypothetical protein [Comamonas sp. Tr-654]NIF82315.1 hypothetical protein [Comamonas sp. Tr-654]